MFFLLQTFNLIKDIYSDRQLVIKIEKNIMNCKQFFI